MNVKEAIEITGGLTTTDKMPCKSINLPAAACKTGSLLRDVQGSVCSKCYARKGRYVFPVVQQALVRRMNAVKNPQWVEALTTLIASQSPECFRFHDSGDIVDAAHLNKIMDIVKALPDTIFWLPTMEHQLVADYFGDKPIPSNMIIRLSTAMIDGEPSKLARKLSAKAGFTMTRVSTEEAEGFKCPATWLKTGKCGDCRACWNRSIKTVVYLKH